MVRRTKRCLSTTDIIKVVKYMEDNKNYIENLRPTAAQLENMILKELSIDGNGQSFKRIAADVGVSWGAIKIKAIDLNDIKDLQWSLGVVAEAIATLYDKFEERVPDWVQAVCDSLKNKDKVLAQADLPSIDNNSRYGSI